MAGFAAPLALAACAGSPSAPPPSPFPSGIAAAPGATASGAGGDLPSGAGVVLFSYPVVEGVIYSGFGDRRGGGGSTARYHSGIDISTPSGTPVRAAGAGQVVHAGYGYQGSAAWGQAVVIDHGQGWITLYAHLSAIDVTVGQQLEGGETIGNVGQTGNATGPHLHVEVRHNGASVDPAAHIPGLGAGS